MTAHGKVRSSLLNRIRQVFEADAFFSPDDFSFSTVTPDPDDEASTALIIDYIADPEHWYLTVNIPQIRSL
jgi:hypothetical protein